MDYKIKVKRSRNKKWYWILCSKNGRTLSMSQMYARAPTTVVEKLSKALGCSWEQDKD